MTIQKGVITYTFLFDDRHTTVDFVNNMTIGSILTECDEGDFMGNFDSLDITPVENEDVAGLEVEMGGNGTFFADPDEVAHARLDSEENE